jgi:hypothetical protein
MESNSKYAVYLVSNNQSNEYWKQFLLDNKSQATSVFYRISKSHPVMIQNIEEIPAIQVEWLEPMVIENGFGKLIPINERSMFDLEWLERNQNFLK